MFEIDFRRFDVPSSLVNSRDSPDKEEISDLVGALHHICEHLSEIGAAEVRISGHGEAKWPLNLAWGFSMILQDLPALLQYLKHGGDTFLLDIPAQGVGRTLSFEVVNEIVEIRCFRAGYEEMPQELETMRKQDLIGMICRVGSEFSDAAEQHTSWAKSSRPFRKWSKVFSN